MLLLVLVVSNTYIFRTIPVLALPIPDQIREQRLQKAYDDEAHRPPLPTATYY